MMSSLKLALTKIVATISLVLLLSAANLSWSGGVGGAEAVEPRTNVAHGGPRRVLDDDDWRDTWESLTSGSENIDDEVVLQKLKELKRVFDRFAVLPYDRAVKDKVNLLINLSQMRPESCTASNIEEVEKWLTGSGQTAGPIPSYTTPLTKGFLSMCADAILDELKEKMKGVKVDIRPLCYRLERQIQVFRPHHPDGQTYFAKLHPLLVKFLIQQLDKTYSVPDQEVLLSELFDEYVVKSCEDYESVFGELAKVQGILQNQVRPERSNELFMLRQTDVMCRYIINWASYFKQDIRLDFNEAKKVLDEYMKNPPVLDDSPDEDAEKAEAEDESDESTVGPDPEIVQPLETVIRKMLTDAVRKFDPETLLDKLKNSLKEVPETAQKDRPSDEEESDKLTE